MIMIHSPLLRNIKADAFEEMCAFLSAKERQFEKNSTIFHTGDTIHEIGMVITGSIIIEHLDLWGNKSILTNIAAGGIFAEVYALCREPIMVDVIAAEDSHILFFHADTLMDSQNAGNNWHAQLLINLLESSMHKNLALSERIICTTPKTIRGRLLIYLSTQSGKAGSTTFQIPFNRQQLADYLNLDRSALSKELGKMKKDGLLDYHKNTFQLKHIDPT